jgi:hypothetical protein
VGSHIRLLRRDARCRAVCTPAGAAAKPLKPISGKLSKRGYTVIALTAGRGATTVHVRGRRFRLRPPARGVTLHLRAPDGTYAGPIVVGRRHGKGKKGRGRSSRKGAGRHRKRARRVIVGVKPGARLGAIKVHTRQGYAGVARKMGKRAIDVKRLARATKKGVPAGNGRNVGLVRSKAHGSGNDPDLDGVPNSIDVDDDGDLVLDEYDRSGGARASSDPLSQRSAAALPRGLKLFGDVGTDLVFSTVPTNVNGGSTDEQIAAAQQEAGRLTFGWLGIDPGSGEIDCGTLIYCSPGGTGRYQTGAHTLRAGSPPFPECCDPDGDGFGSLTQMQTSMPIQPGTGGMALFHGATQDQLHAGDIVIERGTFNGTPVEHPSSVGFVFSTFPVVAAYDDGQGDSGTFTYPHPFVFEGRPVRAGPSGAVVVRLTFWRPQRLRIEGDPGMGRWIDIGNLAYGATALPARPDVSAGGFCPQSSYSEVDPNLTLQPPSPSLGGPPAMGGAVFADSKGDLPSSPANTFALTLNLTDCLASKGLSMGAEPTQVGIVALTDLSGAISQTASSVALQLQP